MYKEHPNFTPPPPEAVLWRYMDFTKFVTLIDRKSLFFVRADKLGDPFEGSTSQINTTLHPHIYEDRDQSARQAIAENMKSLRRFMLVNCWHWSEHESDAMWTRYSRLYDGIAIKTTFEGLSSGFTGDADVYIGKISYVGYQSVFIPENNAFYFYLHKREAFGHEKEVRAIIMKMPEHSGDGGSLVYRMFAM